MSERRTKSEIIAKLAKDYADRVRRGANPIAEEYKAKYPAFSDEIERFICQQVSGATVLKDEDAPSTAPSFSGAVLDVPSGRIGDFRIIRQIGRGGMGIVYEAEQVSLGRRVALKLLPPQMLLDKHRRHRFELEARAAAKLHHTNIVPVFGVGESGGFHYYAMQFIEGLGLDQILKEVRSKQKQASVGSSVTLWPLRVRPRDSTDSMTAQSSQSGSGQKGPGLHSSGDSEASVDLDATLEASRSRSGSCRSDSARSSSATSLSDSFSLSDSNGDVQTESVSGSESIRPQNYWDSVADIGLQVASALTHAHQQGVFHRDIKPSNLLLDTDGRAWVLDFGLAKAGDQHELTHTGDIVGTMRYMPPEAFDGKTDARSDIYSLGLTLYELLSLRPAFRETDRKRLIKQVASGEPIRLNRLNRSIPRDLVTIVHKAIDRDPNHRYPTAEELYDDLHRYVNDQPIRARRTSTVEHAYRWARRNRALAFSIGLITLLLVVINVAGPILTIRLKHAYDAEVRASRQAEFAYEAEVDAHDRAVQAEQQAVAALELAKQKERESSSSLRLAEEREVALNRTLYRAEMSLAGQAAVERTGIERVWRITTAWRPGTTDDDLRNWEWYYLHGLGHLDEKTISIESSNARSVAWHPAGSQIALGLDDGSIEVWDLRFGGAVFRKNKHEAPVLHVCWNSDGTLLASIASQDDVVRIWEPAKDREIQTLELSGSSDWSGSVSFNRNDRLLAADTLDEIAVWDLKSGERLHTIKAQRGISQVAWSPVDDRLAAASKQQGITIWDGLTGKKQGNWPSGSACLAWDPQGHRLAFGGQDRCIHVLDTGTGDQLSSKVRHVAEITTLAWDRDGMQLASAGRDTTVRIWDGSDCDEVARLRGHVGAVTSLDWNPLGTHFVTAAQDQTVKIWDASRTEEQLSLQGVAAPVQTMSWGPQSDFMVASSGSWSRLWNVDRGTQQSEWQGQIAVLHPSDDRIAIAAQSEIQIRNCRTGKLVKTLGGHTKGVTTMLWDSEGKRLASASWDGTARIWDVEAGNEVASARLSHLDRELCWSPDGTCLAIIGNRDVQIWSIEDKTTRIPYQDEHQLHAIAWSPNGQHIATSGWGHEITVWEALTGETVAVLTGHTSPVTSLCWDPTGSRLASGSADQLVRIWDIESRCELLSLQGHDDGVTSICWSPDGMRIASGDQRGRILIWDASSGHLLERTPRSLAILTRRIEANPNARDLAMRADVLEDMGQFESALKDRRTTSLVREASLDELASNPISLGLLTTGLCEELRTIEEARWTRVTPFQMTSDSGATLSTQPDSSIFVTGPNTSGVQYELSFHATGPISALRLEAIPDSRLPHGGAGRSTQNGNFHVAEINLFAASSADEESFVPISISKCTDDLPEMPAGCRAVQSIDGKRDTRWDSFPKHKQRHWAVYEFAEPLGNRGENIVVRAQLDSGISPWGPHGLGRFRFSVTSNRDVVKREEQLQFLESKRSMGITHLAGVYAMLGETDKAVNAYAAALRSAKDHVARQAIVTVASRFDGIVDELFTQLPDDPWLKLAVADSLIEGPNPTRGDTMCSSAVEILLDDSAKDSDCVLALMHAAFSYQANGQWESSLKLLKPIYQRSGDLLSPENPQTIELLAMLAVALDEVGEYDQSTNIREQEVALRQRVQGMDSDRTRASCRKLAELYFRSGQIPEAIALRSQIAETASQEDINESQQAAFFLIWQHDYEQHAALCQRLLAAAETAESVKASRDFAKAVCMSPMAESDLVQRASALATKAVDAAPSNLWGVLSQGMCHYRKGELTRAGDALRRAAAADEPRLGLLARAFLAMTRFQQGETEEARDHLLAIEDGLGMVAFTDLSCPNGIHHDDLAIWLALQEVRQVMQAEPADIQQAIERLLQWQRKVVEDSPDNTLASLHLAALYAWFGKDGQHNDLCQRILAGVSESKEAATLERAAKAYLIHPAPEPDLLDAVAATAASALEGAARKPGLLPWARLTAGIAFFRKEQYPEAIELLTLAQESSNRLVQGPSLLFRSMAFLQHGQPKRAEQDFAIASELMGPRPAGTALTETLTQHDELVFLLAYEEARQQLAESSIESAGPSPREQP